MFKSKNHVQGYVPGWTHQLQYTVQRWPSQCPCHRLTMSLERFSWYHSSPTHDFLLSVNKFYLHIMQCAPRIFLTWPRCKNYRSRGCNNIPSGCTFFYFKAASSTKLANMWKATARVTPLETSQSGIVACGMRASTSQRFIWDKVHLISTLCLHSIVKVGAWLTTSVVHSWHSLDLLLLMNIRCFCISLDV
jgi:hypothetical protein